MSWSLSIETDRANIRPAVEEKGRELLKTDDERQQLSRATDAAETLLEGMTTDRVSLSFSGHVAGAPGSGTHDKASIHVSVNEL
jgi:hypothetical protein